MRRRKILGYAIAGLLSTMAVAFYFWKLYPAQRYAAQLNETSPLIKDLRGTPPPGVLPLVWTNSVDSVHSGFANAFFGPEHSSYNQLVRFDHDLREKLAATPNVDSTTLWWIWCRLEQIDSRGGRLAIRYRPWLEEIMVQLEADERRISEAGAHKE